MFKLFLAYEKRRCAVIIWLALMYCTDLVIPAV